MLALHLNLHVNENVNLHLRRNHWLNKCMHYHKRIVKLGLKIKFILVNIMKNIKLGSNEMKLSMWNTTEHILFLYAQ